MQPYLRNILNPNRHLNGIAVLIAVDNQRVLTISNSSLLKKFHDSAIIIHESIIAALIFDNPPAPPSSWPKSLFQ
jgi:hypothetical protein